MPPSINKLRIDRQSQLSEQKEMYDTSKVKKIYYHFFSASVHEMSNLNVLFYKVMLIIETLQIISFILREEYSFIGSNYLPSRVKSVIEILTLEILMKDSFLSGQGFLLLTLILSGFVLGISFILYIRWTYTN